MARRSLPWPLPALLAWALCWLLYLLLWRTLGALAAMLLATLTGLIASVATRRWWRRVLVAAGFPLSLAFSGHALFAAWVWLLPAAMLLLVYPLHAWRDAPLFPTPPGALDALPAAAPLPAGAHILDAGCGLGDGLRALRRAYPQARLHGLEWSWPLRWLCALRCPWAQVRRADIWAADWNGYQLVYLFQRPESMSRALIKSAEMAPGSWLVSLEFALPDVPAHACLRTPAGRPLWIYQAPCLAALAASQAA
ncbi:class I SAM-dependent methyltransferase [Comamonas sp. NLF-1-9]|uniref:class I SAM-dependent methyltransferase n=1 Tax=Comamonas sp. NLF-1-9 TaxID=2853163 RepID=UPI001C467BB5|nr:class I SAM-dependent methyltransferase [Comamonas sp. NLF-1-9]QXL83862.1 class I SAM-dependent methyltransferase [Comamonas sp. NLF-1-9]